MDLTVRAGDVVETKKPHPCGGRRWEVVRTGAEYKIRCLTCGRTVVLDHDGLAKRLRRGSGEER